MIKYVSLQLVAVANGSKVGLNRVKDSLLLVKSFCINPLKSASKRVLG